MKRKFTELQRSERCTCVLRTVPHKHSRLWKTCRPCSLFYLMVVYHLIFRISTFPLFTHYGLSQLSINTPCDTMSYKHLFPKPDYLVFPTSCVVSTRPWIIQTGTWGTITTRSLCDLAQHTTQDDTNFVNSDPNTNDFEHGAPTRYVLLCSPDFGQQNHVATCLVRT